MSLYYNHGKLAHDVSSEGVTLRKGQWAVVEVMDDGDGGLCVFVGSGAKNVWLPFYGTDHAKLVTH